jgi:hypothetical protein
MESAETTAAVLDARPLFLLTEPPVVLKMGKGQKGNPPCFGRCFNKKQEADRLSEAIPISLIRIDFRRS